MSYANTYSRPLQHVTPTERVEYLKKVLAWTCGGLFIAAIFGVAMTGLLAFAQIPFLTSFAGQMIVIFGSMFITNVVAQKMVFGDQKVLGFVLGNAFEGIALGYILLMAVMVGLNQGNPFGIIFTALGLTGLTAGGMVAYVWTNPKEFKMLGALLSALTLPMFILMGLMVISPSILSGGLGFGLCVLFVVVSAASLLYQINAVIHQLNTDQHIEGSYLISIGILVLFWNLLFLLIQLSSND